MRPVSLALAPTCAASAADARIPLGNATCGNNLFEVHADEDGPVHVNGHKTRRRVVIATDHGATRTPPVVSIAVNPDGALNVSGTRPEGNGTCNIWGDNNACPPDVAGSNRSLSTACT